MLSGTGGKWHRYLSYFNHLGIISNLNLTAFEWYEDGKNPRSIDAIKLITSILIHPNNSNAANLMDTHHVASPDYNNSVT